MAGYKIENIFNKIGFYDPVWVTVIGNNLSYFPDGKPQVYVCKRVISYNLMKISKRRFAMRSYEIGISAEHLLKAN